MVDSDTPISPELVLVCPELRESAVATLREREAAGAAAGSMHEAPTVTAGSEPPERSRSEPPLLVQILGYAAWQILTGGLRALAAVLVVSAWVVAIDFIMH